MFEGAGISESLWHSTSVDHDSVSQTSGSHVCVCHRAVTCRSPERPLPATGKGRWKNVIAEKEHDLKII